MGGLIERGSDKFVAASADPALDVSLTGLVSRRRQANISLLPLPPYSPELNPVENIWQYLRQNYLANRVFEKYATIVDACCDAWNAFVAKPETITSIATRA